MIENIEEIRKVIFPITWTPEGLIDTRTRCNITREEAGELFGVSRQTIYNIENGKISNPAIILAYGTALERYYAYLSGFMPGYREIGDRNFASFDLKS